MSSDTTMTNVAATSAHIDPSIFTTLQAKIDEESSVREELKAYIESLSKQSRLTSSIISRIHNTPTSALPVEVLGPAQDALNEQTRTLKELAETASKYPFYRWNSMWTREIQAVVTSLQLLEWLSSGNLITLEEVGQRLGVPTNLKAEDAFHIPIEDYLLALTSMIEELARLAPNAVTLGDYARPLQISKFVKDVHAGFQLLNLKNDVLRRRSDAVKYQVKKVEDVVYDLSLRGLIPKEGS